MLTTHDLQIYLKRAVTYSIIQMHISMTIGSRYNEKCIYNQEIRVKPIASKLNYVTVALIHALNNLFS